MLLIPITKAQFSAPSILHHNYNNEEGSISAMSTQHTMCIFNSISITKSLVNAAVRDYWDRLCSKADWLGDVLAKWSKWHRGLIMKLCFSYSFCTPTKN